METNGYNRLNEKLNTTKTPDSTGEGWLPAAILQRK